MQSFFKILENSCKYSSKICNKFYGESTLLNDLSQLLPQQGRKKQYNPEDFPFINEVISLLNTIFTDKKEEHKDTEKLEHKIKVRVEYEERKRVFQNLEDNGSIVVGTA